MMTNLAQASQIAQNLSDQQLAEALSGQMQLPPYVAAAEAMRRQQLRRSSAMQGIGQQQDNGTVVDALRSSIEQGAPQAQQPQPHGYANGGVVSWNRPPQMANGPGQRGVMPQDTYRNGIRGPIGSGGPSAPGPLGPMGMRPYPLSQMLAGNDYAPLNVVDQPRMSDMDLFNTYSRKGYPAGYPVAGYAGGGIVALAGGGYLPQEDVLDPRSMAYYRSSVKDNAEALGDAGSRLYNASALPWRLVERGAASGLDALRNAGASALGASTSDPRMFAGTTDAPLDRSFSAWSDALPSRQSILGLLGFNDRPGQAATQTTQMAAPPSGNAMPDVPAPQTSPDAQRVGAPQGGPGMGIRSGIGTLPPEIAALLPKAGDTEQYKPKSLAEYQAERAALMPHDQAMSGLERDLADQRGAIEARQGQLPAETMLKFATGLMANKSPNFLSAVGEAGSPALDFYNAQERLNREDKLKLSQMDASVQQARRAEAIGNVDAAQKRQDDATKIYTTMSDNARTVGAHVFGSYLGLLGQQAGANASMANARVMSEMRRDNSTNMVEQRRQNMINELYTKGVEAMGKDPMVGMLPDDKKAAWLDNYVHQGIVAQLRAQQLMNGGVGALAPQSAPTAVYDPATGSLKPVQPVAPH